MSNLSKALELVKEAFTERTDEDNPYHGGCMNNKEHKRWLRIINTLEYMISIELKKERE